MSSAELHTPIRNAAIAKLGTVQELIKRAQSHLEEHRASHTVAPNSDQSGAFTAISLERADAACAELLKLL